MTDITIDLNKSESFVVSPVERPSDWTAGFLSYNNLLSALGTEDERTAGAMLIESPTDLYSRLSATYDTGWYIFDGLDPDGTSTYKNETPDKDNTELNPSGLNWPNGAITNLDGTPTGFSDDFFSVLNYLQYGGKCFVVGRPDNLPDTPNNFVQTLENTTTVINCVYTTTPSQNDTIIEITEKREDCIAICQVNVKAPISSATPEGFPTDNTNQSRNTFHVAGQKIHLGSSSTLTTGTDTDSNFITTGVAADVAGCMARVRSSTNRYGSPAGIESGALLNVVRMQYDLTADDRTQLAKKFVNPIRTFAGLGVSLQGDRTGNKDISSKIFNYVNVALTYIHINQLISRVVIQFMFLPNTSSNRAALTASIESILRRMTASGALAESSVICDDTNNPEGIILDGNLVVDVVLKFILSIQNIALRFRTLSGTQTTQSLNTSSGSGGSSSTTSSTTSSSTSSTTSRSTSSSGGSSY